MVARARVRPLLFQAPVICSRRNKAPHANLKQSWLHLWCPIPGCCACLKISYSCSSSFPYLEYSNPRNSRHHLSPPCRACTTDCVWVKVRFLLDLRRPPGHIQPMSFGGDHQGAGDARRRDTRIYASAISGRPFNCLLALGVRKFGGETDRP